MLGLAPFSHSMGLCCVLHHALASGGTVVSLARFDLEVMLRAMVSQRVSQAIVAPPLLAALAHHPPVASFDLSSLHVVGIGGAPAPAALERAAVDRLGCLVGQGYGMTEAGPLIAVTPIADPPADAARLGRSARAGHGGEGHRYSDERAAAARRLRRGLGARPAAHVGYLDDPEATAATIDADGWLRTGDLGHVDEDGYVFLGDRLKELIKVRASRSRRPSSRRCSRAIPRSPARRSSGWPTRRPASARGRIRGARRARPRRVGRVLGRAGRAVQAPRAIVELDALPRSPTGKLLRRMLVERAREAVG